MRTIYKPEGKPDCNILEEFFDGTMETPEEKEKKAERMMRDQRARNKRKQIKELNGK